MVKFANTTPPPTPRSTFVKYSALVYAGLLVVMVMAQLFKFEEFVPLIESFGLGGGEPAAQVLASVLVIAEVFALPYLLRMYLSPLFRIVSMAMGWLVVLIWLYITVSLVSSTVAVADTGFLGTAIEVPFGWWSIAYVLILGGLMAIASWGMVPKLTKTTPVKK